MKMGATLGSGSRRSFLRRAGAGISGALLASGAPAGRLSARGGDQSADSLRIARVEPHLLTGVRGYGPWLLARIETADGLVGWGEGTNFPRVQPVAAAVRNPSHLAVD